MIEPKKVIKHIRRWNVWRKRNRNQKLHKLLVLFGIIKSPTMCITLLREEQEAIQAAFEEGLRRGKEWRSRFPEEIQMAISEERTGKIAKQCLFCGNIDIYQAGFSDGKVCSRCGRHSSPIGFVKK